MAWNQNKPLAGDLLSQSQADLQGNFQALNGMLDPINPTLKLTSIAQTPVGPNQLNMFVQLDPTTGNTPQLFVQRETGSVDTPTLLNFTGSNKTAASGWTYLPSGLELFWGTGVGGTAVAFADGGFDNNCFS